MRAACYARVSSAGQRERDTIASQLRVLPEYVTRQGWTLTKTYVDDGRSAKAGVLDLRTGFADMLRDAAAGLFDVIVVVDVDRLTRSEDLQERGAILGALQKARVKLASATSGQVLDLSTSTGDLFTSLHAFFAAEWSRKHRERVKQGKITSISRGRKPGGRQPYGLAYSRATGAWSIDPIRGPIVVEMFLRIVAGESCRQIADDFHRRGIPRPRGEWCRSRVNRIIRATYPIGSWLCDKSRGLKIAVPALVDEDLWQRAQVAVGKVGRKGLRKTRHEYLLEGIGVCGLCGEPIQIRSRAWDPRRNGRHNPAVYVCRGRRLFRRGEARCLLPIVPTVDADARVWAQVVAEIASPGLAEMIAGEIEGQASERHDWQADAEGFRRHLDRLARVESTVLERFGRGLISDAAMDAELARLTRERDALRLQLANAERAQSGAVDTRERLEDAQRVLAGLREAVADDPTFAVRRRLVELLVPSGGLVFVGGQIRVTLLVPRGSAQANGGARVRSVDVAASSTLRETHLKIRVVA